MVMNKTVSLEINGRSVVVPLGTTVAAAVLRFGPPLLRRSVTGQPRGPLCGMGICFECRVTIDGLPQRRSCQTLCRDGMEVFTND
jgi:sarcosine oxidase subunit alpha